MSGPNESPDGHSFVRHPHRTMLRLSVPVMISMIAEPLTGLVDTAFIARLGAAPLAALGVGTVLLSSIFWAFNFLGIGTQTEVAHALGDGEAARGRNVTGLALALSFAIGMALLLLGLLGLGMVTRFMTANAAVQATAITYLKIRLLAAPAVLLTVAAFGALRGLQDMRTPLWIAVASNAINVALDAVLIFGLGPIPAFGIAGAAWATVVAQWLAAAAAIAAVRQRPGLPSRVLWHEARSLLVVGRDLFFRTGLLITFVLLGTRAATHTGVDAGAAHQAIRQVWLLTAFVLDAYAASAQSLIGYFLGAARVALARRVAAVATLWATGTGVAITAAMILGTGAVAELLVPESAHPIFGVAWLTSALVQPLNAISFATDGILWGARDYRYLRNAMFLATGTATFLLFQLDLGAADALNHIWIVTAAWIAVRSIFGIARIWPGIGASPFAE